MTGRPAAEFPPLPLRVTPSRCCPRPPVLASSTRCPAPGSPFRSPSALRAIMAEGGLTPSEAAKELEHHRHPQHDKHGETRREVIAVLEAVLLSVVTIVTAWAGYSAAKWGTESRLELAHGSA